MKKTPKKKTVSRIKKTESPQPGLPTVNPREDVELLKDFIQEAHHHLASAHNSLLVLENVPTDHESIDNLFKTFHTVKGLADFLTLADIRDLSAAVENLLDLLRKETIVLDAVSIGLISRAIDLLRKLLEILGTQLNQKKIAPEECPSVGGLIGEIQNQIHPKKKKRSASRGHPTATLPIVRDEVHTQISDELETTLKQPGTTLPISREFLTKLLDAFRHLVQEWQTTQSSLQKRQGELLRERDLALSLAQQSRQEARVKGEYLAHMAHEIRTLLSAIMGFADLLKGASLTEKQHEHLDTIVLSGNMMYEIVNHILDYAKVEAGKLTLEIIEFNLDRVIEEVFKVVRPRILKKSIDLFFSVPENVPRKLLGDPTRLKQIFINLLDNAIKFTERGEIGLDVALAAPDTASATDVTLKFMVVDTGIGIPGDRLKHVFESFAQASDSTTRLYGGSGLGLSLCKSFIESMGGEIHVESELGQGSRFIFTIKLRKVLDSGEKEPATVDFGGSLVLIVDSHEASSKTLCSLCEKFDLSVLLTARTAKQATEFLLQRESTRTPLPAIIFIDTHLPDQEGFQLAQRIRQQEHYRKIKLVATSSDVKITSSEEYQKAGFDFFLAKPFISAEVADVLRPLQGENLNNGTPQSALALRDKFSMAGIRVLVAEDSPPNRELLKVHFDTLGCACDFAKNGKEAIDRLQNCKYDVCFMDLQMPVMGGLEATKIIRQELKMTVPIVALTAAEFQEEKDKCYELGMNDYLSKPFGPAELKEKIFKCTKI